ncbi:MAG: gas vesicle protein K [Micromonospora sp.]
MTGPDRGRDEAADLAAALGEPQWQAPRVRPLDRRLAVDRDSVERGLASLVLTVVELLRQLMERQALRRVDLGDLTEEQIERVGATLMALEEQMTHLREYFGLSPEDLNLDLGPLGPLLPTD